MKEKRGLYVHIPFCIKKCAYCDFVSCSGMESYFDEYIEEIEKEASGYSTETVDTVFIGGGTPTVLSAKQLTKLCCGIKQHISISDNAEYTIEANPKTLDESKLEAIKKSGINRISIGVQSFNDSELKAVGRIHNSKEAVRTIEKVKEYGFCNINLDIMMNLPNQTDESLLSTLETAVGLEPAHLSCYSLILEENTPLFEAYKSGKYKEPDQETDRRRYHMTIDFLNKHGYNQYEISNFAKPGKECRHNIKYWSCSEYIGLGAAAHSYYKGERFSNTDDIKRYISGNHRSGNAEKLSEKDRISEYMIMKLRMTEGVSEKVFYEKFGKAIKDIYTAQLESFIKKGLIKHENGFYSLTEYGTDISNYVMCDFLID